MADIAKKMTWWERTALVRSKRRPQGSTAAAGVDEVDAQAPDRLDDGSAEQPAEQLATPGAVAVHGPGYRGSDEDDDDDDEEEDAQVGRVRGEGENDEVSDAPLHVDSYAVNVGPTDEEIRQRILDGAVRAEAVTSLDDQPKRRMSRPTLFLLLLAVFVVVAVVVGVSVPLATRSQTTRSSEQGPDENLVASVTYREYQDTGGISGAIQAQTRLENGAMVTTGLVELVICSPGPCMENEENCALGEFYTPGCCAGPDCPEETKCGELCPPSILCFPKDPDNITCTRAACYDTCVEEGGDDAGVYNLTDHVDKIDCLEVGTAVRPENGERYKWAIYCGPVIIGPIVRQNRDLGEYQCQAARSGASFSLENGGSVALGIPCQFIALAECGCGPSDMYTFGLPDPTGPCLPGGGCPFLCEDAGTAYAQNLCRSFPGNISWWEGQNAFNRSQFNELTSAPKNELDIYIKGIDGEE
jgi:hypothetical protein